MNIDLYGTGRAAGALGIAFTGAGHVITGVHGRSPERVEVLGTLFAIGSGSPDLRVIAVSDDAISDVALQIAQGDAPVATVHISGAVAVDALSPIAATGCQVGSFHPLQTMPDPVNGANQLPGSWVGITAQEPLRRTLVSLAESIGCRAFNITDDAKPLYHAAAAAAANFTLTVLALAEDLFDAADVPFSASKPLVEAIITNAFTLGPHRALTGPIARGDVETVARQLDAVASAVRDRFDDFATLSSMTARTAGTDARFTEILG
jgi:predicted short-subunit dehydrogenase-like oxidoreductase (DUF2520 family)